MSFFHYAGKPSPWVEKILHYFCSKSLWCAFHCYLWGRGGTTKATVVKSVLQPLVFIVCFWSVGLERVKTLWRHYISYFSCSHWALCWNVKLVQLLNSLKLESLQAFCTGPAENSSLLFCPMQSHGKATSHPTRFILCSSLFLYSRSQTKRYWKYTELNKSVWVCLGFFGLLLLIFLAQMNQLTRLFYVPGLVRSYSQDTCLAIILTACFNRLS